MARKVIYCSLLVLGLLQVSTAKTQSFDNSMPVRISRTFLQKNLTGKISVNAQSFSDWNFENQSPVTWTEEPTQIPAPDRPVIGDFRDFKGCAQFDQLLPAAVCFNVMPDVYSVGVNSKDMSITGIEDWVADQISNISAIRKDQIEVKPLQYIGAKRDSSSARIYFTSNVAAAGKAASPIVVEILFSEGL